MRTTPEREKNKMLVLSLSVSGTFLVTHCFLSVKKGSKKKKGNEAFTLAFQSYCDDRIKQYIESSWKSVKYYKK